MLDRWNTTVEPEEEIWHLGDFALGVSEAAMAALLVRCTAA
ncbi:MAG: metallophosphoesterase, partial [Acetobacteraceae bacterium]